MKIMSFIAYRYEIIIHIIILASTIREIAKNMESQIEIFVSCLTFMIHSNCTMRKFSYIHQGASKQNKDRLFFDSFVAKCGTFNSRL